MDLIFTDLDGTLLDHDTYSVEPARPALEHLRRRGIPWIPVTSKTRAELEVLRRRLHHGHPFIVENGGAAFVPEGCLPDPIEGASRRGAYDVLEWGRPYDELTGALRAASRASNCRVRSFGDMTVEEVAAECGLSPEDAALARRREYDEPFLVLDLDRADALAAAIAGLGLHSTRGGRFWHILGASDKGASVDALSALYRRRIPDLRTIGLGDGLNDASFLARVDVPVVMQSPHAPELQARLPRAMVTSQPGPAGWNDAILALTSEVAPQ